MKKLYILFDISCHDSWIAGVYYMRNIIFQITQSEEVRSKFVPIIVYNARYSELFERFKECSILLKYNENNRLQRLKVLIYAAAKCAYIYYYHPFKFDPLNLLRKKAIDWIPDFQECYYPQFFSNKKLAERKKRGFTSVKSKAPLVLSSQSSHQDFNKYFSNKKKNIYVIPFVSGIDEEVKQLDNKETLQNYGLKEKEYIMVSNQFWQHKNHIVVLKAIKELAHIKSKFPYQFVFTGMPDDYRNRDYYNSLLELLNDEAVNKYTNILGFIDRKDQLLLMKYSKFIIQPSLFEGWGTVVEDAKVLDKLILLSDIPVHHEQMNENCVLFNPNVPYDLAEKIIEMSKMVHEDDIEKGIKDMYVRAKEYSKEFQHMLEDLS